MKLSKISVQPSALRHLAESIYAAPPPVAGQRCLSYHLLFSAMDLGVLTENSMANMLARARASTRPLPDVDNLLWITAPDIGAGADVVKDLVRRAGHLPGHILDQSTESKAWWNEAYELFSADDTDQARIQQQIQAEAESLPQERGPEQDAKSEADPASPEAEAKSGKSPAGPLDDIRKQLADVVARHKKTGDSIDSLIQDLRAKMAARDVEGAKRDAAEILKRDAAEAKAARPAKPKPDTGPVADTTEGPVTKRSKVKKPGQGPNWADPGFLGPTAEDCLLARAVLEESMLYRGEEVLEHALAGIHRSGCELAVTPFGLYLFEGWRDKLAAIRKDGVGQHLKRGFGGLVDKGKAAWRDNLEKSKEHMAKTRERQEKFNAGGKDFMKTMGTRLMDRLQDPEGTQVKDDVAGQRIQNVLLAKSAVGLLAQTATDKLMRLPMGKGEELMNAERTEQNRKAARVALGLDSGIASARRPKPRAKRRPSGGKSGRRTP